MPTARTETKLATYRAKRDFTQTREPSGEKAAKAAGHSYLIQKHAASRLHYDFRLELGGVLKSWAVTRGPSLNPADKRLAVHVEDHPLDYGSFEGTIPQGQYGGGTVMLWDQGTWEPSGDPERDLKRGNLTFTLHGKRLKGRWHLVRLRGKRPGDGKRENWLLIKGKDEFADTNGDSAIDSYKKSIVSNRSMEEIARGSGKSWGRLGAQKKSAAEAADAVEALKGKTKALGGKVGAAASSQARQAPEHGKPPVAVEKTKTSRVPASKISKGDATVASVRITHPDRVLWAEAGITKLDLARYYAAIAPRLLAQAGDRPLSLVRCPSGAGGACFFQRHVADGMSSHVHGVKIAGRGDGKDYIYVNDAEGLVSLVQMGAIEFHAWNATVDAIKSPDRLIFDLDPAPDVSWQEVKNAALDVRTNLKKLGLVAFLKTTGGKGLHVVVPFARGRTWSEAKSFARAFSEAMAVHEPERFTVNSRKAARKGRIFLDYLRNDETASAVAAYSVRARPGAPVSMPIDWKELSKLKTAAHFGIKEALARRTDPWKNIEKAGRQALPSPKKFVFE
jgi:bifunctional non-homologous end joining protein LigD